LLSLLTQERQAFPKLLLRLLTDYTGVIYQYLKDATMSNAGGGQMGLKVFFKKNLFKQTIFPQVAIKFVLKHIK